MIAPEWIAQVIQDLPPKFTGYVQINCVDGGVASLTRLETIRPRKISVDTVRHVVVAVRTE